VAIGTDDVRFAPVKAAVLGSGGVGGLLAAVLPNALVVSRSPLEEIRLRSRLLGDRTTPVRSVESLEEFVDVLFIATKATGLHDAVDRIEVQPGVVVPLLNGFEHVAWLRERFADVVAATIRVEATRVAPGVIEQTSPFLRIELAAHPEVADLLNEWGIVAEVVEGEAQVMWSKLSRLNAIALTTTAFGAPLGEVRSEHRDELVAVVRETAAVAAAEGASVDVAAIERELLVEAHPELLSSMARDVAAGRPPELDAIGGAVLRAAERHGVATPTVAQLVEAIQRELP
jgi:2-dehydropantoate 2-reductase